jgi:predicted transcriptional regulator
MDKNKIRGIAALAIVLVVYNVLAFAIPFPKNGCFWAAWVFGLVAILAQAAFLLLAFQHGDGAKSKFYGFPVARVGVVYLCVQLVLSFLFMGLAFVKCPAWIPVVLSVILLAAAALGLIVTDAVRDEVERQDSKRRADTLGMKKLYAAVAACADRCADPELKKPVQKLAEALRYADPVSSEATREAENTLRMYLVDLESAVDAANADKVKSACAAMTSALADRNRLSKLGK